MKSSYNNIKYVVFDWGGVVVELKNGGWTGYLCRVPGMTYDELEPHWKAGYIDLRLGLIGEDVFWERFK